ncbi:MAG: Hpt domain-containing protein, partial [Deltaproteobacteria bacterium]
AANAAHSIKGAAANLGLTGIHELAAKIEAETRKGRFAQVPEWILALREELNRIEEDLEGRR